MGYGLAQLNKFDPETGETTAVGNLVDKVNNIWGNTFDVYKYENQWYILDTGAGLAHLNKFDPETGATTAVGVLEDKVNHFWGSWDIQVIQDGDTWCILDMEAGLLHANVFEPDTGKTILGYNIADHVNYIWGIQFDTYVKDNKRYIFDVGAGLGHLNILNCNRCSSHNSAQSGKVSGLVFFDGNNNGKYNSNELGEVGIKLTVIDANLNTYIVITDDTGHYTVSGIALGEASVTLDITTLPLNTVLTIGDLVQHLTINGGDEDNTIIKHGYNIHN